MRRNLAAFAAATGRARKVGLSPQPFGLMMNSTTLGAALSSRGRKANLAVPIGDDLVGASGVRGDMRAVGFEEGR